MKRLSERLNESWNGIAKQPSNNLINTGVTNHYTPVQNILTNVKNLFCSILGLWAEVGEDGFSIKISSSRFSSQQETRNLLQTTLYNDAFNYGTNCVQGYIMAQGLPRMTMLNVGGYYVVYFSPDDIRAADSQTAIINRETCPSPCEMKESLYDEFEFSCITEEDSNNDDKNTEDDKNTDDNKSDNKSGDAPKGDDILNDILNNEDKVKAAKQLEVYMSQKISFPRDYYFAAIKFKNEDEAIAFRWKYTKELPTGKSTENVRSLIHIFASGEVWVQDFAKDSIVQLPDEVKKLIDNILKELGANKTSEPDIFKLKGADNSSDDKEDSKDADDSSNDDQNNDDNKDSSEDAK